MASLGNQANIPRTTHSGIQAVGVALLQVADTYFAHWKDKPEAAAAAAAAAVEVGNLAGWRALLCSALRRRVEDEWWLFARCVWLGLRVLL